jgi:feruloyl esterase
MFHCNSGAGAWVIGQGGGAAAEGIDFQSESNVLAAMVEWVEGGRAPEVVLGTKFVNDTVGFGVSFRRAHCRYVWWWERPITNACIIDHDSDFIVGIRYGIHI